MKTHISLSGFFFFLFNIIISTCVVRASLAGNKFIMLFALQSCHELEYNGIVIRTCLCFDYYVRAK
jgi:hypothetical protein